MAPPVRGLRSPSGDGTSAALRPTLPIERPGIAADVIGAAETPSVPALVVSADPPTSAHRVRVAAADEVELPVRPTAAWKSGKQFGFAGGLAVGAVAVALVVAAGSPVGVAARADLAERLRSTRAVPQGAPAEVRALAAAPAATALALSVVPTLAACPTAEAAPEALIPSTDVALLPRARPRTPPRPKAVSDAALDAKTRALALAPVPADTGEAGAEAKPTGKERAVAAAERSPLDEVAIVTPEMLDPVFGGLGAGPSGEAGMLRKASQPATAVSHGASHRGRLP
jgi:hypothetical protein